MVLNKINYKGKNDWNSVSIFWLFIMKGKYFGIYEFVLTYMFFFVILIVSFLVLKGFYSII